MNVLRSVLVVGIVLTLAGNAMAGAPAVTGDMNPPDWRGNAGTTSQIWNFDYDPGTEPDSSSRYYNPDGPAAGGQPPLGQTHAIVFPGGGYLETDTVYGSNRYGIWTTSGYIDVTVDNYDTPNEFKWMWVQITWAPDMVDSTSGPTFTGLEPAADADWPVELIDEIDYGDGWCTSTYQWRIYPNPTQESFRIGYDSSGPNGTAMIVDSLVIDTWCVPEPATIGLLVIGGLAVLSYSRKKGTS